MSCSLYLVFEYMEHDLAGLAASLDIKFTEPQVKFYMHQLISGLEHCHNHGVLHCDIKGSNLLLDNGGILKIADFGLATFFLSKQETSYDQSCCHSMVPTTEPQNFFLGLLIIVSASICGVLAAFWLSYWLGGLSCPVALSLRDFDDNKRLAVVLNSKERKDVHFAKNSSEQKKSLEGIKILLAEVSSGKSRS
uniref:Protein kinase domain-containing protein n=1 Tax=Chenopodium quinoa TaxID=63459 RepID=A0A803N1R4_CHEQI